MSCQNCGCEPCECTYPEPTAPTLANYAPVEMSEDALCIWSHEEITTHDITMPAVGNTVDVTVCDSALFTVGQYVYFTNYGYLSIVAIPDATTLRLMNMGTAGNSAPGTAMPAGADFYLVAPPPPLYYATDVCPIDGACIADNSIANNHMLDDAIGTAEIQDGSITAAKLAPGVGSSPAWMQNHMHNDLQVVADNWAVAPGAAAGWQTCPNCPTLTIPMIEGEFALIHGYVRMATAATALMRVNPTAGTGNFNLELDYQDLFSDAAALYTFKPIAGIQCTVTGTINAVLQLYDNPARVGTTYQYVIGWTKTDRRTA